MLKDLEETMKLRAMIVATAAVVALVAQGPQVLAQGANAQTGASRSQGSTGAQERSAVNTSPRGSDTTKQSTGGRAESGERSSVKSQTRQTNIERGSRGSEIT